MISYTSVRLMATPAQIAHAQCAYTAVDENDMLCTVRMGRILRIG